MSLIDTTTSLRQSFSLRTNSEQVVFQKKKKQNRETGIQQSKQLHLQSCGKEPLKIIFW